MGYVRRPQRGGGSAFRSASALGITLTLALTACDAPPSRVECLGAGCGDERVERSPGLSSRTPARACALHEPGPAIPSDSPPSDAGYDGPPIGAIRWDAWTNDPNLSWWSRAGLDELVPPGSKFHFRRPSLWDDFQLYGHCVDTQAIVDAEIKAAKGKLDFWLFDWYPPRELLDPVDQTDHSDIQLAFDAYSKSASKRDIKFALLLQYAWMMYPDGSGAYFQAYSDWIARQIRDPQYQRIDGKPLLVLYNDAVVGGGWAEDVPRWEALKETIGEDVFGVSVNSVAVLRSCGLQANMKYGPNGATLPGAGRHAYQEQCALDAARDGAVPGAERISSRTAMTDRRPFMDEASTSWTDQPTQPEWFSTLQSAVPPTQKFVIIYSWNEMSEGGPGIVPTFQEGTRYLDAIGWVRSGERPNSYTYPLDFTSLYLSSSSGWTESFPDSPNVIAAHDGDEVVSSTAGEYKEFSHSAIQEVHIHATKGPDRGFFDITTDSGEVKTVDLYSARTVVSADVARLTFTGAPATHTVRVTVRGEKNPLSTSTRVGLDYASVTYSPAASVQ